MKDFTQKEKRDSWPLTFAENQMAIEYAMNPNSVEYNVNVTYGITGDIDVDRLEKALNDVMDLHPITKSYYPMENGEFIHKYDSEAKIKISQFLCDEDEVRQVVAENNMPFNIDKPLLFRCLLLNHGYDKWSIHFCFHHIIYDAGSERTLMGDLFKLYNGKEVKKPEFDFFDHAIIENSNDEDLINGEKAFNEIFSEGVPENEMPTVPVRPEVLPYTDVEIGRKVPVAGIEEAAKRLNTSNFRLVTAVLGITLGKYCGSEDVVIGTAMSGRTREELIGVMGMFVNSLPLHLKPKYDMEIKDFVKETAAVIRKVKANQNYPFERIVSTFAPDRNSSRSPIFDVMLNYLEEPEPMKFDGVEVGGWEVERQALAMDFTFEVMKDKEYMHFDLAYSRKLYLDEIAENFLDQYVAILNRIIEGDGSEKISDLADLPQEQTRQILEDFAGFKTDEPVGKTIVSQFREIAKKVPNNMAVVFKDEKLTYEELDKLTDKIAGNLNAKGIGKGSVVGILINRGVNMAVASLAVLKSGGAYLPMDPGYPSDRLEYMLEDTKAKIVIAEKELYEKVPSYSGEFFDVETFANLPEVEGEIVGPAPEDLMILLYTSGTTGKPKGVMILHENIMNFIHFYAREYKLTPNDSVTAYASFGFDANMMDTYPTLISGSCLHILPDEMRLDLDGIAKYFEDNNITVAFMTTQLGRQFAERKQTGVLRALSVGGEALVPIEPPEGIEFFNLYGPTECTIASNRFKVDKMYDRMPIGKAVDNTAIYVIDSIGNLAPVGVAGELCIAGRQVAKGYLNREDLTEEKFVKNPFNDDPEYVRMYKTGDVVRYLPSGDIDFVGRRDFQVKIRGFRVELTEIEARIREFEEVSDATVIAQEDAGGGKRIVAYVVGENPIIIEDLNKFIEEKLPPYMVPTATMQLDRIPLNQNGKVDRKKLPKITIKAEELVQPKTDMEKILMDVLNPIVGEGMFGTTTDLLYAGLNSLSSIKAATLITEATGKHLSTKELMAEKTVERIAKILEEKEEFVEEVFEKQSEYPLTFNQMGLYFACVKEPHSTSYNIPIYFTVKNIDEKKLIESIKTVIKAHPYINTNIVMKNNEPVQVLKENVEIEIPVNEGSGDDFVEYRKNFVKPFNLFGDRLYKIEIFKTPENTNVIFDFHHIVFDGGSVNVFLEDLCKAYDGELVKEEKVTSFDISLREKKGEGYEKAKAFFADRLSDMEGATEIPSQNTGLSGSEKVSAAINEGTILARLTGMEIKPSSLFMGATAIAMSRYASTKDVRFATITNGREGIQNTFGMLVKTLPVALKTKGEEKAVDYLKMVSDEMQEILASQAFPYMHASSEFNFNSNLLFVYQGGVIEAHSLGGNSVEIKTLELSAPKFPMTVDVWEKGGQFVVEVEYNKAMFTKTAMEGFANGIIQVAQSLAMEEVCLSEIGLLPNTEMEAKDFISPKYDSLHEMFYEAVDKNPSKTALISADKEFTFEMLDKESSKIANSLIENGVEQGDKVAIMLNRSYKVIASMLGVMKAGGVYIPIDPDYPKERISHIIEDSEAKYIISQNKEFENSILIDEILKGNNDSRPNVKMDRGMSCYMIYTSGSTGKPKGVEILHEGILNYVQPNDENIHVKALIENDCTMLSITTVSFDMFLKESFTTLMNGLTLVFADDDESKDPRKLGELFAKTKANAFNATPSRMQTYMGLTDIENALAKCKVVMAGGEKYPASLYKRLKAITNAVLINTYGPTEITVSSNAKIVDDENITIGKPLYNVVETVMDIEEKPLPDGATGELYIGGLGVAKGYVNRPDLTAEQFVVINGTRYYKSGDLAKKVNGEYEVLGRMDSQIKLRGLRIELGEIENTISSHPAIAMCGITVKVINGTEHICAYYTTKEKITPEELREHAGKTLTPYMVPTGYLEMDKLPTTPNGKTDIKGLPQANLLQKTDYVEPENDGEKAYCEIFSGILGIEKVGAIDNFFDLGGSSLLVTEVIIAAQEKGLEISYADVFSYPTPRELSKIVVSDEDEESEYDKYDYTAIHNLLKENNLEAFKGEKRELGNVCITGSTGFLGIHILREFLENEKGTAYCVVRGDDSRIEKRLKAMLVYYFSNDYSELFGTRIIPVSGDVTGSEVFDKLSNFPVDTFINCAANVKHFSAGEDIKTVNAGGVQNAIKFCMASNSRLIQISTTSVAGMCVEIPKDFKFDEEMFYFGQDLSNKYTSSKFDAERAVYEAIINGLDGKVMRVGNLMARESDGEFQINFNTNNFMGRLRAYSTVGCVPYEHLRSHTEFAPIDCTAKAVLTLSKTPKKCIVFHPYNDHVVYMADVVNELINVGGDIEICDIEKYESELKDAMKDKNKALYLNSLIAYDNTGKQLIPVKATCEYTSNVLLRMGFLWPITSEKYLKNFFNMMIGLGYFD